MSDKTIVNDTVNDIDWPKKTREIHSHHFNSTMWNGFEFRDDDIVIATYAKSGTTWVQQIVGQLIFEGAEDKPVAELSPWVDLRVPSREEKMPIIEAQTHRRYLKTHLPVDGLVFSPKAKYIYIARDGRDVAWSMHHHHINANDVWYKALNESPGLVGPPIERPTEDVVQYFREWVDKDGFPWWPYFSHIRSWWNIRHLPNVMLLHFADLKADSEGQIRRIAEFLDMKVSEETMQKVLKHTEFSYMKQHAALCAPLGGVFWDGGPGTFINKGTNGRWRDILPAEDSAKYEARAEKELGSECAEWLKHGWLGMAANKQ